MIHLHTTPSASFVFADTTGVTSEKSLTSVPFDVATKTILKLNSSLLSVGHTHAVSSHTIAAMQRLVNIINQLRSTTNPAANVHLPGQHAGEIYTPETIAPYVSEEAYEVIDALLADSANIISPSSLSPALITGESLFIHLLWCIASSSYSAMQLIEGVRVRCLQPGQPWMYGMLRLVAILEATTETTQWSFDLATGQLPASLIASDSRIQSDDNSLPIKSVLTSETILASEPISNGDGDQADRVDKQLQVLTQQLEDLTPSLKLLLSGVPIELLQPGTSWQRGSLRLKLGFEFIAQDSNVDRYRFQLSQSDLVEAELLEDTVSSNHNHGWQQLDNFGSSRTTSHPLGVRVAVVELPSRSLSAATLIRLADTETVDRYAEMRIQQQLSRQISQLKSAPWLTTQSDEQQLIYVVQAAFEAAVPYLSNTNYSLLQPELLIDELIPKLLWQLTKSSYTVMQLIGSLPAQVLQPSLHWEFGALRLLPILQIQVSGVDYQIDLATCQLISTNKLSLLTPNAICQVQELAKVSDQSHLNALYLAPVQAEILMDHLLQQIQAATPEIDLLLKGVQIEWLEAEQDWQPGTLRLALGLEFTASDTHAV